MAERTREECRKIISDIDAATLDAIAQFIETADTQGDYTGLDDCGGSMWEDDATRTLNFVAGEIRNLKGPTQ